MALKFDNKYDKTLQGEVTGYGNRTLFDEHQNDNGPYSGEIYSSLTQQKRALADGTIGGQFSYNPTTDPAYQAYRSQYLREGQRAMQNTMAQASAMTGGRPSSYAVTAAAQQNNYYNSQLADKIPELYNQAYNRYVNNRDFTYQAEQDRIKNMQNQQAQEYNIFNTDRNFQETTRQNRIQNMQTQQQQDWNRFLQQANMALSVGDYNMLKQMGFDTSRTGFANDYQIAALIAQYTGDTSGLRALMGKG